LGECELVLFNTGVKHSLADSAYNRRRESCETGLAFFRQKYGEHIRALRDVSPAQVRASEAELDPEIFRACTYVCEEIVRTLAACEDLNSGRLADFGQKMFATHAGLRHLYEVSCPELDFLVDAVQAHPAVLGARVMGGGFGGCTINIVQKSEVDRLYTGLAPVYAQHFGRDLGLYRVLTAEGSGLMDLL
jgi:galactokinase